MRPWRSLSLVLCVLSICAAGQAQTYYCNETALRTGQTPREFVPSI
jgi:hypothetical protein